MFYYLQLNRQTGDMYCRASGLWDVPLAERFRRDMKDVRSWAQLSGLPLTILTDLTGLPIHAHDVAQIVGEGANYVSDLPVARYAMIVPSALMRMQVRRIDPLDQRRFFDDVHSAAEWLGWRDSQPVDEDGTVTTAR